MIYDPSVEVVTCTGVAVVTPHNYEEYIDIAALASSVYQLQKNLLQHLGDLRFIHFNERDTLQKIGFKFPRYLSGKGEEAVPF